MFHKVKVHRINEGIELCGDESEIHKLCVSFDRLIKCNVGRELVDNVGLFNRRHGDSLSVYLGPRTVCNCPICHMTGGGTVKNCYNYADNILVHDPNENMYDESEDWMRVRHCPEISLGHELVHAYRTAAGIRSKSQLKEEHATIGLGPWAQDKFTENAIRKELGLPLRPRYNRHADPVYEREAA